MLSRPFALHRSLVALLALVAAPAVAQVVIEAPVRSVPHSTASAGSSGTFVPTVSGTLRVRYVQLNQGQWLFQSREYADLNGRALDIEFDGAASSDPLPGRFAFRRRMVGVAFSSYWYDATFAQTRPQYIYTSTRRTEGIDEYGAEPTVDLGEVEAGVPFSLGLTYRTPDAGSFPLTLTEQAPPAAAAKSGAGSANAEDTYTIGAAYNDCCSPIGTPIRLLRVVVEVVAPSDRILVGGVSCGAARAGRSGGVCTPSEPMPQDTIRVGEGSEVKLDVPPQPGDAVDLRVSTALGRLVRVVGADTTALTGPLPYSDIASSTLLFLADGEWPRVAESVAVQGTVAGTPLVAATIVIRPPLVRLLRQNDAPLDSTASTSPLALAWCDCAMVSKLDPNALLSTTPVAFTSTYGRDPYVDYDPDTLRPEVSDVGDSLAVQFVVDILRAGSPVRISTNGREVLPGGSNGVPSVTFASVAERQADGSFSFRADRHVRFVSNSEPAAGSIGGTYDDEVAGTQTLRVELGDVVRTRIVVGADTLGRPDETLVGRPRGDATSADLGVSLYAQRSVALAWHAYSGLSTAPATVTGRMAEDFGQVSLAFTHTGDTFDSSRLQNVVEVSLRRGARRSGSTSRADTLQVQFIRPVTSDTTTVALVAASGQSPFDLATAWTATLATALGLPPSDIQVLSGTSVNEKAVSVTDPAAAEDLLIVLDAAAPVRLDRRVRTREIQVQRGRLRMSDLTTPHLGALAALVRDGVDTTVDVIPVENGALYTEDPTARPGRRGTPLRDPDLFGKGLADRNPTTGPRRASVNVLFVNESSADQSDDLPFVAGHEVGHVLHLSHTDVDGHFSTFPVALLPADGNLMFPRTNGGRDAEAPDDPKRLRPSQQLVIRQLDRPQSGSVSLLQ